MATHTDRSSMIIEDTINNTYICSPAGAAFLLDMPIRQLWREMIETGRLRVNYLPDGRHEIVVPKNTVINLPSR